MKRPALREDTAESWSIECLCVLESACPVSILTDQRGSCASNACRPIEPFQAGQRPA